MRTELWGLRNTETQELVLTYWASSQKHKALFSTREKAEDACKHNPQYEPFRIEAKPVMHGRWIPVLIDNGWVNHQCSMCGYMKITNIDTTHDMNYCPNCGADMRERRDNDG